MLIFYEDHINHTSIKDNGQGMVRRLGSEEEGGGEAIKKEEVAKKQKVLGSYMQIADNLPNMAGGNSCEGVC